MVGARGVADGGEEAHRAGRGLGRRTARGRRRRGDDRGARRAGPQGRKDGSSSGSWLRSDRDHESHAGPDFDRAGFDRGRRVIGHLHLGVGTSAWAVRCPAPLRLPRECRGPQRPARPRARPTLALASIAASRSARAFAALSSLRPKAMFETEFAPAAVADVDDFADLLESELFDSKYVHRGIPPQYRSGCVSGYGTPGSASSSRSRTSRREAWFGAP